MNMRLITKRLCSDPWIYDIPLSYNPCPNDSFSGYFTHNNKLAAIARVYKTKDTNTAELSDIYVSDEFRGKLAPNNKKWSDNIMISILNAIQRRKIKKIWLWTTTDNIPAIKLYYKFGFMPQIFPNNDKKKIYNKNKWLKGKELIKFMKNVNN